MEELWKVRERETERGKLFSPFFLNVNVSGMVWADDRW